MAELSSSGDATADGRELDPEVPRVVVGVDGSAESMRALAWAATEARLRGGELEVVHANFYRHELLELFADDALVDERAVLDRAVLRARELEPGIRVTGRICEPPATKALVEASEGADLLVVGSRGLGRFQELTIGSVSNTCAHHARCPIVIVRPRQRERSSESHDATSVSVPPGKGTVGPATGSS
jgi:nucleotide-binding universal stress UspA family protein